MAYKAQRLIFIPRQALMESNAFDNGRRSTMKALSEITFGFSDAENYRRRENKVLFNQIFLRTEALKQLHLKNKFFLVGEKGTGKTAYAVYLSNQETEQMRSFHRFIRETEYLKFMELKRTNNLSLSDYNDIWRVIILLLIAKMLYDSVGTTQYFFDYPKFKKLNEAIDEYYKSAFAPEISTALQFVENSTVAAEILAKHLAINAKLQSSEGSSTTENRNVFQTNMLFIERQLRDALSSIRIPKDFTIFVDGIDIRPSSVPYDQYLDCVKGLANAAWSLNNDYFPAIKDFKGRIKCILLLRPDIFNSLGQQNRNTKLRDNSVLLNLVTDYSKFRMSDLFLLADRLFSAQQDLKLAPGQAWDYYFPFNATGLSGESCEITSFIVCLRYSYHRPRDILTLLDILNDIYVAKKDQLDNFRYDHLFTPEFRNKYGEYLLGEIKDSLSFYYDQEEFEIFLKFFEFLAGRSKFSYDDFLVAFGEFEAFLGTQSRSAPDFMKSSDEFLQFLYDQNILSYTEQTDGEKFFRWCFRERSLTNISPKVKTAMNYEIHYGLMHALNTGKPIKKGAHSSASKISRAYGEIVKLNKQKRFGFIQQPGIPVDIYFSLSKNPDAPATKLKVGSRVNYILKKNPRGGLLAMEISIVDKA